MLMLSPLSINTVRNANNNLLDLIFQDKEAKIVRAEQALRPEDIYHPPRSLNIKCQTSFNNPELTGNIFSINERA